MDSCTTVKPQWPDSQHSCSHAAFLPGELFCSACLLLVYIKHGEVQIKGVTILPGGCCHGNASAMAMIAHSCLINWFFNASWFVRTLKEQVHGKWKINGFLFPSLSPLSSSPFFPVLLLILLKLFPHVLRSVVMAFWIMIGSWRLPWMGGGGGGG